ncbi:MAG: hypothetical protein K8R58_10580, partial [Bacteroidales bacterium]|nr:hypothetical protein [Bacteroidales bacterium]
DKFSGSYFNDTIGSTSLALTNDIMFDLVAGDAEILLSRETHLGDVSQPDGDAGGRRVILVEAKKAIVLN